MTRVTKHISRRQKAILVELLTVVSVTLVAVVAMVNFKDWVNRSEAMRAMEQLGRIVFEYRSANGALPSESFVKDLRNDLEGGVRMGDLRYRALWIDFVEADANEILAYSEKRYRSSLLADGYVVLFLDGTVSWMTRQRCEKLLAEQQSEVELEMQKRSDRSRLLSDPNAS